MKGSISIDFARLSREWAIGLLALTFRDLLEGDIRLGFGRAKGFGEISASFDNKTSLVDIFNKSEEDLKKAVGILVEKIGGKI